MHIRETYISTKMPMTLGLFTGVNEQAAGDVLLNYG